MGRAAAANNTAVIPTKVGIHDKTFAVANSKSLKPCRAFEKPHAAPLRGAGIHGGRSGGFQTSLWATALGILLPFTAHAGLFNTVEIKGDSIASFTKWVDVLGRIRAQHAGFLDCYQNGACAGGMTRWKSMMEEAGGQSAADQLDTVNGFFNDWPYIEDINLYGRSDYWATPREFLKNSGDCEDYAIAKFVSLRMLGWGNANLRVVILRDTVRRLNHAVLAAKTGGLEYILDNLASSPLPSDTVIQYSPYYAVNETTRWIFIKPAR